jgi:hypothetical protein
MKPCMQTVGSLFFCLGGGRLVDVLDTHFYNPNRDPTVCFTISSPRVCLRDSLNAILLPRLSCCFRPRSLTLLLCFGCVQCLLLCFGCAQCLIPNFCPLGIPCTTLSLVRFFSGFWYPTASSWSLDHSFSAPTVSTEASWLGIS